MRPSLQQEQPSLPRWRGDARAGGAVDLTSGKVMRFGSLFAGVEEWTK